MVPLFVFGRGIYTWYDGWRQWSIRRCRRLILVSLSYDRVFGIEIGSIYTWFRSF